MRILIAEDDHISRRILTAILRKWDYDPVVTEDGLAAWEVMQQPDAPQLVLLDWGMPKMEGPELCRRIRAKNASNPPYVILVTGRDKKVDIVQGLDAGANDYIVKPYDPDELQARIRVGRRMIELQTSLIEARDALEHQAMHDPLTGLLNRRAILNRLAEELARAKRERRGLSIGVCDIDHFKSINDTFGHQAGDEVLTSFGQCMKTQMRIYDSLGRYGGEEFIIISTASGNQSKGQLYERLRQTAAAMEIEWNGERVCLTISIGVAAATEQSTVDGILSVADVALYKAKAAGRNRVIYAEAP